MAIKNIIFDLGGVLLNIDFNLTRQAFEKYGFEGFDAYYQQSYSSPLFSMLEQGRITPAEFYAGIRDVSGIQVTDEQIRNAWNALLLDFRRESIALLESLKNNYKIYLLSNTNELHYDWFVKAYNEQFGGKSFDANFHKAYYSHLINLVKPGPESYLFITNENNLQPAETLFIDDTLKNIEGAEAVGLQTLYLQKGQLIENILPELLAEKNK